MRRTAGFHDDGAGILLLENAINSFLRNLLTSQRRVATTVHSVDLEDRFGCIQADHVKEPLNKAA